MSKKLSPNQSRFLSLLDKGRNMFYKFGNSRKNENGGMRMRKISFLKLNWKALFTLAVFLFAVSSAFAQNGDDGESLAETLKRLSEAAGYEYVAPLASPLGTNLNGGWFHRAPPPKIFGIKFEFGLVGMGTYFPDDADKQFSVSENYKFTDQQAREIVTNTIGLSLPSEVEDALVDQITQMDFNVGIAGATIIGSSDNNIEVSFSGANITFTDPNTLLPRTEYVDPRVLRLPVAGLKFFEDHNLLPFAAPQVSVGTILGTQAVFRYVPEISIPTIPLGSLADVTESIGKFRWFGWGIQHNPGVFFPTPLPVDISLSYFNQTIELEGAFKVDTKAYGLTASKQLGIGFLNITPYAGYLIEKSDIHFEYKFTVDDQEFDVAFDFEGENKSRIIVGLSMKLLIFNINADYNIGNYKSVTVGVMIGL
jgi:hypothetical protein